jgi:para-aminobenzoate synthetase/4-amino-4-deoxychorismate lyase
MENNSVIFIGQDSSWGFDRPVIFRGCTDIITTNKSGGLEACLERIDKAVKAGHYTAGFLSYEAGEIFQGIASESSYDFPLLWFGIYKKPEPVSLQGRNSYDLSFSNYSMTRESYIDNISLIKDYIVKGYTYQTNYTFKNMFLFNGSAQGLFMDTFSTQPVGYGALITAGDWKILSFSPELFFSRKENRMTVKPMKGTVSRGTNTNRDAEKIAQLKNSKKDRAENLMIVDLLRNDLARISKTGSVRVDKLFDIEKYSTLFQMTSTISSELKENISWKDIFLNIFPSGSVTGAPKHETMKIIKRHETDSRKIYTGTIGYISSNNRAVFNVAIRTMLVNSSGQAEMGIGSGIVYDSDADKEYSESVLKSKFLTQRQEEFSLIETMLYENGRFFLLKSHLERLMNSAKYFNFRIDLRRLTGALRDSAGKLKPSRPYRLRIICYKAGGFSIETAVVKNDPAPVRATFSDKRTDPDNIFLFHKTTNRKLYDSEYKKYSENGFFDCLFLNKKGEVTEGAISNIFIKTGGNYFTPPAECGLLSGVMRNQMIRKLNAEEKILYPEDIMSADEIILSNSVRGFLRAELKACQYF